MSDSSTSPFLAQDPDDSSGSFRFEYIRIEQGSRPSPWSESAQWVPPMDVYGTEHAVFIEVLLPGILPDETQLELNNDQIRVSGFRRDIDVTGRSEFYHVEISRGNFLRVVSLPKGVDVRKANITFDMGILRIEIPWSEQQWAACRKARFPEEWT